MRVSFGLCGALCPALVLSAGVFEDFFAWLFFAWLLCMTFLHDFFCGALCPVLVLRAVLAALVSRSDRRCGPLRWAGASSRRQDRSCRWLRDGLRFIAASPREKKGDRGGRFRPVSSEEDVFVQCRLDTGRFRSVSSRFLSVFSVQTIIWLRSWPSQISFHCLRHLGAIAWAWERMHELHEILLQTVLTRFEKWFRRSERSWTSKFSFLDLLLRLSYFAYVWVETWRQALLGRAFFKAFFMP